MLPLGEIYSASCALLWAAAVLLFRKSGESVPPVALNLFKSAVAVLLFGLTMLVLRVPLLPAERTALQALTLLASGAVGIGIADSLFFASLNRLGASRAAIVNCAYSPFIVLCARVYLDEPLRPTLLAAVALMVGAILLGTLERLPPADPAGTAAVRERRAGVGLGILAMFLNAVGIVIAKPVLSISEVLWATPVRLVGGEAVLLGQVLLFRSHRTGAASIFRPSRVWIYALPSALVGSYLAMMLWISGMKLAPVSVAGILNQTSTLWVPVLAAIFLREPLTARRAVAVALGFAGAVIATR